MQGIEIEDEASLLKYVPRLNIDNNSAVCSL